MFVRTRSGDREKLGGKYEVRINDVQAQCVSFAFGHVETRTLHVVGTGCAVIDLLRRAVMNYPFFSCAAEQPIKFNHLSIRRRDGACKLNRSEAGARSKVNVFVDRDSDNWLQSKLQEKIGSSISKIVSLTIAAREVRTKTRCNIGCPAMSARIFPGKRDELIRPCLMATTRALILYGLGALSGFGLSLTSAGAAFSCSFKDFSRVLMCLR
jgi:hypothetical protein